MRWASVGSGTRNARAISSVVSPPSSRSVSATRASVESTGWQVVKIRPRRSSPIGSSIAASRSGSAPCRSHLQLAAELLVLAVAQGPAAQLVDAAPLRGGHEPGAGVVRHARLRPRLERRHQRVLGEVLGQADVADHPRQAGDQPRRLDPPDRLDRAVGVARRRGRRAQGVSPPARRACRARARAPRAPRRCRPRRSPRPRRPGGSRSPTRPPSGSGSASPTRWPRPATSPG